MLSAESRFFTALIEADAEALDRILADDFVLVDVMRGGEITKAPLLAVVGSRQMVFGAIERIESHVRIYASTGVVVGRTRMSGRFGETPFTVESRYTHVYVNEQGRWRLVSAQGTRIADDGG